MVLLPTHVRFIFKNTKLFYNGKQQEFWDAFERIVDDIPDTYSNQYTFGCTIGNSSHDEFHVLSNSPVEVVFGL